MRRGFTLVELLTVFAVIAILAGLATAGWAVARKRAQVGEGRTLVAAVATAIAAYPVSSFATVDAATRAEVVYRAWDWNNDGILDGLPVADETGSRAAEAARLQATGYRGFALTTQAQLPSKRIDSDGHVTDPWGSRLRIAYDASRFGASRCGIWSFGPDRIDQGGATGSDDLASWTP